MAGEVLALAKGCNTLWKGWEEALAPWERVGGKRQALAPRACPRARLGDIPVETPGRGGSCGVMAASVPVEHMLVPGGALRAAS